VSLSRALGPTQVDIVKVAHHGSSRQEKRLLAIVDAALAVVSVGTGNPYGHPSDATLDGLASLGWPSSGRTNAGTSTCRGGGGGRDHQLSGDRGRLGP